MKLWAVLILNRILAAKMINLALQLNVMLFLLHLLVPHVGQQVQFRAGGEVGAEK